MDCLKLQEDIIEDCRPYFKCFYEEKDAIGKRYRRQDAIGTPFCVTVDHQTKEDGTVTITISGYYATGKNSIKSK